MHVHTRYPSTSKGIKCLQAGLCALEVSRKEEEENLITYFSICSCTIRLPKERRPRNAALELIYFCVIFSEENRTVLPLFSIAN